MLPSCKAHRCWKKELEQWVSNWLRSQRTLHWLPHHWPVYLAVGLLAKSTFHDDVQGHQVDVFKNLHGCFLSAPDLLPFILAEEAKINIITTIKWSLFACFFPNPALIILGTKPWPYRNQRPRVNSPCVYFGHEEGKIHTKWARKSMMHTSHLANGLSGVVMALHQTAQSSTHPPN